ncbi:MAG: hypothetical protein MJ060_02760 [Clostridia bacterium]|nr:hypothetical protein [Clostridia bacterium]
MKRYDYLTEAVGVVFTASQTETTFQIISLILTCLSFIVSIAFTIYNWYKKAKADGKIEKEELKELAEIGKEAVKDGTKIVNDIKNINKK